MKGFTLFHLRKKKANVKQLVSTVMVIAAMGMVACVGRNIESPPPKSQAQLDYEQTVQLHQRGIDLCTALGPATSMEQLKIIMDCIEKMNAIDAQYQRDLSTLQRQRIEQMNQPSRSGWVWVFPPNGSPYPVYVMGD